jgi:cytochrome c oxidase subunit 2
VRKNTAVQMIVFGTVLTAVTLVVVLSLPWFPALASTQAKRIHTLYNVLLIASAPIFSLVVTVVIFSVIKFRMRPGEEDKDGPPIHGNTRLEVIWTAGPAVLILGLCIYSYTVLRANEDSHKGETLVNVTERQFAFEFSYPRPGGGQVVSPVLYLADDHPYLFHIRSLDVIHSFFVPDFSEKIDAVPGITTDLRVTPTRLGVYPAECTELCGAGHAFMRAEVEVVTPAKFQAWLSSQKANGTPPIGYPPSFAVQPGVPGDNSPAAAPSQSSAPSSSTSSTTSSTSSSSSPPSSGTTSSTSGTVAAGKAIFTGSAGCSSCHTLGAAGASGTVGPDLDTRLRSDCATAASKKIRGSTLTECIHTAIVNPYAYIPTGYSKGVMPPNFSTRLSSTQISDLVTFLSTVAK